MSTYRAGLLSPKPLAAAQVERAALPAEVLTPLERLERACGMLGFAEPVFHLNQSRFLRSRTAGCFLREPLGETVTSLLYVDRASAPVVQECHGNFFSRLQDGRLICTSDQPAKMDSPFVARHLPGATPVEVYAAHRQRLDAERSRGNPPVPVRSFDELAELHWQIEGQHDGHEPAPRPVRADELGGGRCRGKAGGARTARARRGGHADRQPGRHLR